LHALTLLNDLSMLEASRAVARQVVAKKESADDRLVELYRRILSRSPTKKEMAVLKAKLQSTLKHYQAHKRDALQLLSIGQLENRGGKQLEQLAAYMIMASMVYNLDEAMTHE